MSAPNISFRTARSPNAFGMILEPTAFLDKESFKQIRRPDRPMRHRKPQVGDAGFEVIHEAGDRAVILAAVVGNDASRQLARNASAWRLIGRLRSDFELRPSEVCFPRAARQRCLAHRMRNLAAKLPEDAGEQSAEIPVK
jgi:hypothetical protein